MYVKAKFAAELDVIGGAVRVECGFVVKFCACGWSLFDEVFCGCGTFSLASGWVASLMFAAFLGSLGTFGSSGNRQVVVRVGIRGENAGD